MNYEDLKELKKEFRVEAEKQYGTKNFSVGISSSNKLLVTFNNNEEIPQNLIKEFKGLEIDYERVVGKIEFQ